MINVMRVNRAVLRRLGVAAAVGGLAVCLPWLARYGRGIHDISRPAVLIGFATFYTGITYLWLHWRSRRRTEIIDLEDMPKIPTVHFEYEDSIVRSRLVFENGDSAFLAFTRVGPDLYRLEMSSITGEVVYGDIIRAKETADGALLFAEIVEPSNLTTLQIVWGDPTTDKTDRIQSIRKRVIEAGGMWERVFGGILIVSTPPGIAKMIYEEISHTPSRTLR